MTTFRAGDVIVGPLQAAQSNKTRPAVVLSTQAYHATRPDIVVGIITTNTPAATAPSDHVIADWQAAGLKRPSAFRTFIVTADATTCRVIGHLSPRDWQAVQAAVRAAIDTGI